MASKFEMRITGEFSSGSVGIRAKPVISVSLGSKKPDTSRVLNFFYSRTAKKATVVYQTL